MVRHSICVVGVCCVVLGGALPASTAWGQQTDQPVVTEESSYIAAMDHARQELVDATPRGGASPPELLRKYLDASEAYADRFPVGERASSARATMLSCLARLEEPQRVINTVDGWLAADVLTAGEFDRALRMRFLAVQQLRGPEAALLEAGEAVDAALQKHVRLLLAKAAIGEQSAEQRLATIDDAIRVAGTQPTLRAESLASKAMALMEQGGEERMAAAKALLEEAQQLDAQAFNVVRARMQMRSRAEALAGAGDIAPGKVAPTFALNDIRSGDVVNLVDLRGDVVLLDFWATWCGPCLSLMDSFLADLHRDFGDKGLKIVGIGTNWRDDTAAKQLAWADAKDEPILRGSERKRSACNWTKVHDPAGGVTQTYGVRGIPFCVLIDAQGAIVYAGNGHALKNDILNYVQEHCGKSRN